MSLGTIFGRWCAIMLFASGWVFGQSQTGASSAIRQKVLSRLRSQVLAAEQQSFADWDLGSVPEGLVVEDVELVATEWDPIQKAARFRLRCVPRSACAPFVVTRPMSLVDFSAVESPGRGIPARTLATREKWLVRRGDIATLLLANASIRLMADVTCLESGVENQQIRVRRSDGRVMRARVVAAARVEVSMGRQSP